MKRQDQRARIVEQVVELRQDVAALRHDLKTKSVEINMILDRIDDQLVETTQIVVKAALAVEKA
jgi:hypothetical protein